MIPAWKESGSAALGQRNRVARAGIVPLQVCLAVLVLVGWADLARGDWLRVWSEEFNGSAVDSNRWAFDIGTGAPALVGWGNNELEYYTSRTQNVHVANGSLNIIARKESYGGAAYTSARLKTLGLFSKLYGRFEFRARLPAGQGYWPALWLMPCDLVYGGWAASGEVDIMENKGSNPRVVAGTLHYGGSWPANDYQGSNFTFPSGDSATNFHLYALEWTTNAFRWYVDGRLFRTQTSWWSSGGAYPAPFDQPFYVIINLAVGGNYGGNPDGTTVFPGTMLVDYVRIYDFSPAPVPPLRLAAGGVTENSFLLCGSNGPPEATFYVLTSTNAAAAMTNWTRVATNQFDAAGTFTLPVPTLFSASFYRLDVP